VWLRRRVPDPAAYEHDDKAEPARRPATTYRSAPAAVSVAEAAPDPPRLPPLLWRYTAAVGVLSCGIASFPLLAFHAQTRAC
jgi:hypothetical protein